MTDNPASPTTGPSFRDLAISAARPLIICGIASLTCCWTLGPTLGLAFAGFGITTILSPQFLDSSKVHRFPIRRTLAVQLAILLPIAVAWTWAALAGGWTLAAAMAMTLILVTYTAMIVTTGIVIGRFTSLSVAPAIVTLAALAWLSWPIWTMAWMTESLADWLVSAHPLFAVNAITELNPWPQHEVIYGLSRLGQDVPYALPNAIWPVIVVHAGIAVGFGLVLKFVTPRR